MRAALLPTPGDPFQLYLWFHLFQTRFQDDVDKLYVCYNGALQPDVVEFVRKMMTANPKVVWLYHPQMISHGEAIKELINTATEDLVVLLEDDCLIFKPNALGQHFTNIERGGYDLVGSHRMSATDNIIQATINHFRMNENEPFFWPNLLFTKRENLLKTDQNFNPKHWNPGEYIKEIDWRVDTTPGNDTFVWASIQLLAMNLKYYLVEQNHAQVEDLYFYQHKIRAWESGKAAWVHIGSLSSVLHNFLFDDTGHPLGNRGSNDAININSMPLPSECGSDSGKQELESRLAHTKLAFDFAKSQCGEIQEFVNQYDGALSRAVSQYGLDPERMNQRISIYKQLYDL